MAHPNPLGKCTCQVDWDGLILGRVRAELASVNIDVSARLAEALTPLRDRVRTIVGTVVEDVDAN